MLNIDSDPKVFHGMDPEPPEDDPEVEPGEVDADCFEDPEQSYTGADCFSALPQPVKLSNKVSKAAAAITPTCQSEANKPLPVESRKAYHGGCPECIAMGDNWVHLRECVTCGHVGCCDSSKNKHATAHFHKVGHPVTQSVEPGEDWRYCYTTGQMVEAA